MTTDQLDALPPGTLLYIPTETTVTAWILDRRVVNTNYFTLTHPPDENGVISNKRPFYAHALDLLPATLDEAEAWKAVLDTIEERKQWINRKLSTQQE